MHATVNRGWAIGSSRGSAHFAEKQTHPGMGSVCRWIGVGDRGPLRVCEPVPKRGDNGCDLLVISFESAHSKPIVTRRG
jgi:hypothetical protein